MLRIFLSELYNIRENLRKPSPLCQKRPISPICNFLKRKRRRSDSVLWQNPPYPQKIQKPKDNTQTPPKTSITQRFRTDLGWSVGVKSHPTAVVKPGLKGTNLPTHRNSSVIKRTRHDRNTVYDTNTDTKQTFVKIYKF